MLRLLDEPLAAALAVIGDTPDALRPAKANVPRAVVVFNIGGGSCDACYIEVDEGVLEVCPRPQSLPQQSEVTAHAVTQHLPQVKATVASTVLSGEAFDARLVRCRLQSLAITCDACCSTSSQAQPQVYHLAELFERDTGVHVLGSRKAVQRLRLAASKAKELLSPSQEARVRSVPLFANAVYLQLAQQDDDQTRKADVLHDTLPYAWKC